MQNQASFALNQALKGTKRKHKINKKGSESKWKFSAQFERKVKIWSRVGQYISDMVLVRRGLEDTGHSSKTWRCSRLTASFVPKECLLREIIMVVHMEEEDKRNTEGRSMSCVSTIIHNQVELAIWLVVELMKVSGRWTGKVGLRFTSLGCILVVTMKTQKPTDQYPVLQISSSAKIYQSKKVHTSLLFKVD